jgi:hypothetical protein
MFDIFIIACEIPSGALRCSGVFSPIHLIGFSAMARLTITLSDDRHLALREVAAKRRKTIGRLIEESLDFYGIKTTRSAEDLVAKARARAALGEADALRLATAETRAARRK